MITETIENAEAGTNQARVRKPKAKAAKALKGHAPGATEKTGKGKKPAAPETKTEIVLKKLRAGKGASIAQLGEAIGWQAHSVRGFLSATVKKKLGLQLASDVGKDGVRRYRILES